MPARTVLPVAVALLLLATPASALEVTATLDRDTAQVGEQVLLSVTVEGGFTSIPSPKLPDFGEDFEVYDANRTSRNVSIINGKVANSLTTTFVIVPRKEGTFTLGPVVVETKSETVRSDPIRLTVTAAGTPPAPAPQSSEERGSVQGSDEIFVRATVDNGRPYVNQQVTYRVRLYSRVDFLQSPQFSAPTTQGFWREDLPARQPYVEVVNGKRYTVLEAAFALFPTAPGPLTVGQATLDCTVRDTRRRQDPFSFFGGSLLDGRRVVLKSEPVKLDVRPLPPGAPPGFSGAVGEFQLRAGVDKIQVPQNESVTLTLKLSGKGNLRSLGEIPKPSLPDFRTYPSGTEQTPSQSSGQVGGTLTEQIVLVPLSAGTKTIPSVELPVFSPRKGAYEVLRTDPIPLTVTAGSGTPQPTAGGRREDIQLVGRDIRFLELTVPEFVRVGSPFAGARVWMLLLPLPVISYGLLWLWERQRRRLGADVALRRRRGAARAARRMLKGGRDGSRGEQAARASEALRVYLADRFNLPRAGLTPEQVSPLLAERGLDPGPVLQFLEEGDAARFAPGASATGDSDPLAEVERMISGLEKHS